MHIPLTAGIFMLFPFLYHSTAAPIPASVATLDPGDVVTCGKGDTLVTHDANVAFLGLGGGIAGKIQFLRFNGPSTTGVSGTASVTAQAINGGTTIDVSKGRLEHGWEPMLAKCGAIAGSTVKIVGGAEPNGDVLLTLSHS